MVPISCHQFPIQSLPCVHLTDRAWVLCSVLHAKEDRELGFWPLFWGFTHKKWFFQAHEKWQGCQNDVWKLSKASKMWQHHHGFPFSICPLAFEKQSVPLALSPWSGPASFSFHLLPLFSHQPHRSSMFLQHAQLLELLDFCPCASVCLELYTPTCTQGWLWLALSLLNLSVCYFLRELPPHPWMSLLYASHSLPWHPVLFASWHWSFLTLFTCLFSASITKL